MLTLGCDDLLRELIERGDFLPIVAVVFGCLVGMIAIIFGSITGVMKTRSQEETRRELAAYVAEGSIRPEDAVAMMKAGRSLSDKCGTA